MIALWYAAHVVNLCETGVNETPSNLWMIFRSLCRSIDLRNRNITFLYLCLICCFILILDNEIHPYFQSPILPVQLSNPINRQPFNNAMCVYPFPYFISEYDKSKYYECLEKTQLLSEKDATSLEEAKSFYLSHYAVDREIPRHFEQWYQFAKRKNCRINRYDGLAEQLKPFKDKTKQFHYQQLEDLVDLFNNTQLTSFNNVNGITHIKINSERAEAYKPVFKRIQHLLPNFKFIINTHAQPVVLYNRKFSHYKRAQTKFNQYPSALGHVELTIHSQFMNKTKIKSFVEIMDNSCTNDNNEFRSSIMQGYGLFINQPEEYQTTKLMPILSWGNYPGCTRDILVPSVYHYNTLKFSRLHINKYSRFISWKSKKNSLIWRGATSGSPFYHKELNHFIPSHVCVKNCLSNQWLISDRGGFSQQVWFWSHRQRAATYGLDYPTLMV